MNFIPGIIEVLGGVILIVVPEPATTAGGVTLTIDGIRHIVGYIDESLGSK